MNTKPYFILAVVNDDPDRKEFGKVRYYTNDRDCGNLFDGSNLGHAVQFNTKDEAETVAKSILQEKARTYSDGTRYPPDHISRGLELSNINPSVFGSLVILEIEPKIVESWNIAGKIEKPTGYTY